MGISKRLFFLFCIAVIQPVNAIDSSAIMPLNEEKLKRYANMRAEVEQFPASSEKISIQPQTASSFKVYEMEFSPDSKYLYSTSGTEVKIWDVQKRKLIKNISHSDPVFAIAISPDGRVLASAQGKEIFIWDVLSGERIIRFARHYDEVGELRFSADGKLLISTGEDAHLRLWDMEKLKQIKSIPLPYGRPYDIDLSPNGLMIAAADWNQNELSLWEIETGKKKNVLKTKGSPTAVKFSPDGQYITSGADNLTFWDATSGKALKEVTDDHSDTINNITYSLNGQSIYTRSWDSIRKWDALTGEMTLSIEGKEFENLFDSDGFAVAHNEKLVAIASKGGGSISLLNTEDFSKIGELGGEIDKYGHASLSFDRAYLAQISNTKGLLLWDMSTGSAKRMFTQDKLTGAALSKDGSQIAIGFEDKPVGIYKTKNEELQYRLEDDSIGASRITYSPAYDYIAASIAKDKGEKLGVWDLKRRKLIGSKTGADYFRNIRFHPQKNILAFEAVNFSYDNENRTVLWEYLNDSAVRLLDGDRNIYSAADFAFSRNGEKYAVLKSNGGVMVWQYGESVNNLDYFESDLGFPSSVDFSLDGRELLLGFGETLYRYKIIQNPNNYNNVSWKKNTLKLEQKVRAHSENVFYAYFSGDDQKFYSISDDSTMKQHSRVGSKLLTTHLRAADGEWLTITPDYFFAASSKGARLMTVTKGMKISSLDSYFERFYRPDIVHAMLNNGNDKELKSLSNIIPELSLVEVAKKNAPTVHFLSGLSGKSVEEVHQSLIAKVVDQGDGIGKIVWKHNGVVVGVEGASRGLKPVMKGTSKGIEISKSFGLSPGINEVELIAFNVDNTVESAPAKYSIILETKSKTEKPNLYLLAVGINKYRDKSLRLNYAVNDAEKVVSAFKSAGSNIFQSINVVKILDEDATKKRFQSTFKSLSQKVTAKDVLILYMAGHGVTQEGRYYFLPADMRYRNKDSISEQAINQDDLQGWLSSIASLKSLVLLDTCNSGSYVSAQLVTRGIAEKTAIDKLVRSTGRATIAASLDTQVAYEGYKEHGVFTYSILQALNNGDEEYGNGDGILSTAELASYIDETVPDLTYNKWGYEQIPQVMLSGRPFPIGLSRN